MKTNLKTISLILLSVLLSFTFAGCDRKVMTEEETTEENFVFSEENTDDYFDFYIDTEYVYSEEASEIIEKFQLDKDTYALETTAAEDDRTLVVNVYTGECLDINGNTYSIFAQPKGSCDYCGKMLGVGEGMCNGKCNLTFKDYNSVCVTTNINEEDYYVSK